jgi:Icc-related predicted phosphoesterase
LGTESSRVTDDADLLLIAGDLTRVGAVEEAEVLAGALDAIRGFPMMAVLGNHDLATDRADDIRRTMAGAGVTVLDGDAEVVAVDGVRVGVAGTKGFGGGFHGACATDFGEPEMRAFVGHTRQVAGALSNALQSLDTDVRIALTHYSPVEGTLRGERLEIYPFLGSYLLAEAIDAGRADLAIHGHAHHGCERAVTACGTLVRNVAQPVLRRPYAIYCLEPSDHSDG